MLTVLASMVDAEYSDGNRAHWGSEDRRTKMLFIPLNRSSMYKILGGLGIQMLTLIIAAIIKFMTNAEKLADQPDGWS